MWSPHLHDFQLSEQAMGPDNDAFSWDSLDNMICSGFDDDFTDSVMVKGKRIRYALIPSAKDVSSEPFFSPITMGVAKEIDMNSFKLKYAANTRPSQDHEQQLAELSDKDAGHTFHHIHGTNASPLQSDSPKGSSPPNSWSVPPTSAPSLTQRKVAIPASSSLTDLAASISSSLGVASQTALLAKGPDRKPPLNRSPSIEEKTKGEVPPIKSLVEEQEETLARYCAA
jgi:hypothetical protein